MEYRDYYATLGVSKDASQADIKKAFRRLARENHPDVNKGDAAAEKRFKEISEANEVLSDPDKRKAYDQLGANWGAYQQAGGNGGGATGSSQGGLTATARLTMSAANTLNHPPLPYSNHTSEVSTITYYYSKAVGSRTSELVQCQVCVRAKALRDTCQLVPVNCINLLVTFIDV